MTRRLQNRLVAALFLAAAVLAAGTRSARAVEHASVELTLIWGTDDPQSPDPAHKPVGPAVERLLASSPFRWKHYFEVNRRIEDIESDKSKDKIAMSAHCELDIKYLGNNRVQVKLYGDQKLISVQRDKMPMLLAGDAQNGTAWLVLIRPAEARSAQRPEIFGPAEAQLIEDQFHAAFAKSGGPRILIYVNRDLVNRQAGLRLTSRTERVETTRTITAGANTSVTTHSVANNIYGDRSGTTPTLADRQTVRDLERIMGEPFRIAGASLVDQDVAAQLIGDRSLDSLTLENDQARKDREAIGKIADIALEILVSSRQVTVPEVTGDHTYNLPDIQATAIRLSDSRVLGQAASSDVINKAGGPMIAARNFTVNNIGEATALSLMDDMDAAAK